MEFNDSEPDSDEEPVENDHQQEVQVKPARKSNKVFDLVEQGSILTAAEFGAQQTHRKSNGSQRIINPCNPCPLWGTQCALQRSSLCSAMHPFRPTIPQIRTIGFVGRNGCIALQPYALIPATVTEVALRRLNFSFSVSVSLSLVRYFSCTPHSGNDLILRVAICASADVQQQY